MSSPSPSSPSGLSSTSKFTDSDVAPSPPGLTGLDTPSGSSRSSQTASDVPVGSEETAITVANLHEILARILEQTNALWERQESTNRMLDELRQSISVPQDHRTEIDGRLHRIESLTETLVKQTASRTSRTGQVQESVQSQDSSHSATDVGHSDKPLLAGSLRPQTHISPDIQDQPTSSSSKLPGAVSRRDTVPIQTSISTLSSYDQVPEPLNISSHLASQHETGTGHAAEITVLPPPPNVHGEQPGTTADEHVHNEGHEATVTATVQNTHMSEPENVTEMRLIADQTQVATVEWAVALGNRLADVTNLVQRYVDEWQKKNDLMEQFYAERQRGEEGRDRQIHEMIGMTYWLVKEAGEARQREESNQTNEGKPGIEILTKELHRQSEAQREFLGALSDSWRADSSRLYEEMISAVRATASEQVPYNVQGYLDEFSESLSVEVRLLLGEVGKLREERRNIQHELGFLLSMKSSHEPGGEFAPEWILPSPSSYYFPEVTPLTTDPPLPEIPLRRSAWRPVRPRNASRRSEPEPILVPGPEYFQSWATWQPNPALAPTPPPEHILFLSDRGSPGLFGPPSPRN